MKTAAYVPLLVAGLFSSAAVAKDVTVKLMSWNIRQATKSPSTGEEFWSVRKTKVNQLLHYETANQPEALLCFQEALHEQVVDLENGLGSKWTRVGVGRDDGVEAGEYSPIFFRNEIWDLVENRTYWLSETPDKPSLGWDAGQNRLVTVAHLSHKETKAPFVYMCTHFDDKGKTARKNSATEIVNLAREWEDATADGSGFLTPVFVGGDMNSAPSDDAYQTFVAKNNMHDTRDSVDGSLWFGYTNHTFSGFEEKNQGDVIDHIFVQNPAGLGWYSWGVLENKFDDGIYASDHRPVVVFTQFGKGA